MRAKSPADAISGSGQMAGGRPPTRLWARWYDGGNNWGDVLNSWLIAALSGVSPSRVTWPSVPRWRRTRPGRLLYRWIAPVQRVIDDRRPPVYLVVGSTLQQADARTVVWGAGFIREDARVLDTPRAVHAVRGPLSRRRLLDLGIPCPAVYGDPALLYPLLYPRSCGEARHPLGVIPHLCDQANASVRRWAAHPDVRVIDIAAGLESVVDEIRSCNMVVSSSLHGLVVADACAIPAGWIRLSDGVLGEGFKFRDYLASVSFERPPLEVTSDTGVDDLVEWVTTHPGDANIHLDALLEACPFGDQVVIDTLVHRWRRAGASFAGLAAMADGRGGHRSGTVS